MTSAPISPADSGPPVSSSTASWYPGTGFAGEPGTIGNISMPRQLAQIDQPVSVCHQ